MTGFHSRMISKEEKKFKSSNFVHVNKVSSSFGKKLRTNSGTPVKKSAMVFSGFYVKPLKAINFKLQMCALKIHKVGKEGIESAEA